MKRHETPGLHGLRHFESEYAPGYYAVVVEDRLPLIDRLDAEALREVLTLPAAHLQGSIRQRAERRLRRLEKAQEARA